MLAQLISDILDLLGPRYGYGSVYLTGVRNTLILALAATAIGCVIGFICGILRTIPVAKTDGAFKKFIVGLVKAIVRIYVERPIPS